MHGEPLGRDITALDRVAGWRAGVPCLFELAFGLPMNLLQSLTEMPRRKKMNQMLPQIVTNSTLDVNKWKKESFHPFSIVCPALRGCWSLSQPSKGEGGVTPSTCRQFITGPQRDKQTIALGLTPADSCLSWVGIKFNTFLFWGHNDCQSIPQYISSKKMEKVTCRKKLHLSSMTNLKRIRNRSAEEVVGRTV